MASVSTSTLSRYRPAIVAVATVAAAYSLYLLYDSHFYGSQGQALHRSNAFRRRARYETGTPPLDAQGHVAIGNANVLDFEPLAFDDVPEPGTADDNLTEISIGDGVHQTQQLRELLFAIAKNKAQNQGNVHRGISCDRCGRSPITGNRYKCTNCFDYDLCEECEALNEHLKTHVFYKIRIPAKWVDRHPQAPWYPGKPHLLPPELSHALKTRLAEKAGFTANRVDGLYYMFGCLANKNWEGDHNRLGMAIDRSAFYRCLVPQISTRSLPKPNLIYNRLFLFFDQNDDGLIGFEEFLDGVGLIQNSGIEARKRRVFKSFDLDDDGFVCRKDFLKMFRAYYVMNKDMIVDQLKANREGENAERVIHHSTPEDLIKSSRPLSQYFPNNLDIPFSAWTNQRQNEHKTNDIFGDLVPDADGTAATFIHGQDAVDRRDVYADTFTTAEDDFDLDIERILRGEAPQWLAGEQILVTHGFPHGPEREYLVEHIGLPWAMVKRVLERTAWVKVLDIDIEVAMECPTDWKAQIDNEAFSKPVASRAMDRIINELRQKKLIRANELRGKHEAYARFHLEAESNPFVERDINSPIPTGTTPTYVGGSAAAQTIYDVTQKALNELLDPLFSPDEDLALSVQRSAPERMQNGLKLRQLWEETRHSEVMLYQYKQTLLQLNNDYFWDSARNNIAAHNARMRAISQIEAGSWDDNIINTRIDDSRLSDSSEDGVDRHNSIVVTTTVADLDPTMPQNRPNTVPPMWERQFSLLRDELIAWNIERRGGPGRLSYDEFASAVESAETSDGKKLLGWVADWLNLAMF